MAWMLPGSGTHSSGERMKSGDSRLITPSRSRTTRRRWGALAIGPDEDRLKEGIDRQLEGGEPLQGLAVVAAGQVLTMHVADSIDGGVQRAFLRGLEQGRIHPVVAHRCGPEDIGDTLVRHR